MTRVSYSDSARIVGELHAERPDLAGEGCQCPTCEAARSVKPLRRRTEAEVEAYVAGYRAAIDTVLRTAGSELSEATVEKVKLFAEIIGTGMMGLSVSPRRCDCTRTDSPEGEEWVPLADALADLKARDERQSHWLGRALTAEGKVDDLRRAIQQHLDTFGYDNHEGLADALVRTERS